MHCGMRHANISQARMQQCAVIQMRTSSARLLCVLCRGHGCAGRTFFGGMWCDPPTISCLACYVDMCQGHSAAAACPHGTYKPECRRQIPAEAHIKEKADSRETPLLSQLPDVQCNASETGKWLHELSHMTALLVRLSTLIAPLMYNGCLRAWLS